MLVETVLQKKGNEVATMSPEASLAEAAALLAARHAELIVICDAEQNVIGVLTDNDVMRCIAGCDGEACSCATGIVNFMTRKVVTCKPGDELHEVWAAMNDHGLRRIPVVDDDEKLSGIINLRDVFQFLSEEAKLETRELWRFLTPPEARGEPMTEVLDALHQEHFRIGTVLVGLHHLAAGLGKSTSEAETDLLSTIFNYLEAFPDTVHHPKEEAYLFAALRRRKPDETEVLDQMVGEHAMGKILLSELRLALQTFRDDSSTLERLQETINAYVDFEQAHMRREENVFMPLAARYLKTEDWTRIIKAFKRNDDPLFGEERRAAFDELFNYITEHLPDAPILASTG